MTTKRFLQRFDRHLRLPGFGAAAQAKLGDASVLLVGAGGLGCPVALYLAAAGVGRIVIVDDDRVDETNLQRQVLFTFDDIGKPKAELAAARLRERHPEGAIEPIVGRFDESNAVELLRTVDLVIDGADNFPTRYLVNDAAVLTGTTVVHGSILLYEGQVSVFQPGVGPCYRCLFPEPPPPGAVPSCAEAGVLGVLPGAVGLAMATEAIKVITGIGEPLIGRLACYDALSLRWSDLSIDRDPDCPVCGANPTITEAKTIQWACDTDTVPEIDVAELAAIMAGDAPPLLLDVRETPELAQGTIPGHRHVPLSAFAAAIPDLAPYRHRPVVCQCQGGVRSQKAGVMLREAGFTDVHSLAGGWLAWANAQGQ